MALGASHAPDVALGAWAACALGTVRRTFATPDRRGKTAVNDSFIAPDAMKESFTT